MDILEKPGTVLLFKKEKTQGIYTFLLSQAQKLAESLTKNNPFAKFIVEQITKFIVDYLANRIGHNYIHAELTLEKGWAIAAWFNAVHVYQLDDKELINMRKLVDIYVPVVDINVEALKAVAKKYWRKQYDFASLIQNAIVEILAFGNKQTEEEIEKQLQKYYDSPDKLICSELIARIYGELGYVIAQHGEFVTPDDVAESELFQKV